MYHYTQGLTTRQGHKGIPEGHFEEEQGLLGFFGPVSHLIRPKPITSWTQIEGDLRPHMFDLVQLKGPHQQRLLYNHSVEISYKWTSPISSNHLVAERNADGDLILFCHKGEGLFYSEYGLLPFRPGQYIVVPKCLAYVLAPSSESEFLVIENKTSHYQEPDRGIVGRHAPWDPNGIVKPDLQLQQKIFNEKDLEVRKVAIQHLGRKTMFSYEENIFNVLGWKGDLYPYSLHIDDIMPLMSHRVHLPPSAHSTFVARDFVICTFLPRPLEQDKDALKVPFYHQNIDYDEVLFYHDGDFFSRDNLHPGMMSFHPAGFPHGPHPKAIKTIDQKTSTNEKAVMIDTRFPLEIDEAFRSVELKDYWKSWQG